MSLPAWSLVTGRVATSFAPRYRTGRNSGFGSDSPSSRPGGSVENVHTARYSFGSPLIRFVAIFEQNASRSESPNTLNVSQISGSAFGELAWAPITRLIGPMTALVL